MKVNLSQDAIEAIAEFQENGELLYECIEDVEKFIFEYVHNETGNEAEENSINRKIVAHSKFLHTLRNLIKKIYEQQ